jgi:hypothetical protein
MHIHPKYLQNIESLQDVIGKQLRIITEEETDEPVGYMIKDGEVIGLRLGGCSLSKIPEVIFEFTELELLDLSRNKIEVISGQIQRLRRLEDLRLDDNRISEFPDEIGHLEGLKSLSLCRNSIRRLPNALCKLTGLRRLRLSFNKLPILPREIKSLTSLVILDLSANQIDTLPVEICEMPSLEVLDLTLNDRQCERLSSADRARIYRHNSGGSNSRQGCDGGTILAKERDDLPTGADG